MWLATLGLCAAQTESGLSPELLTLARVKVRMNEVLSRQPNYTCVEEIERSHRRSPKRKYELQDMVRLEVALVDGHELFAWPGSKKFDDAELCYKRLLALWQASAGKEHPMVATTLDKLALLYREQNRLAEGQQAADSALAYRTHFHAAGLVKEARFLTSKAKLREATLLYKQALALLDAKRPEHTELIKQIQEKLPVAAKGTGRK